MWASPFVISLIWLLLLDKFLRYCCLAPSVGKADSFFSIALRIWICWVGESVTAGSLLLRACSINAVFSRLVRALGLLTKLTI